MSPKALRTLSKISLLHYAKLVYRAALFLAALVIYIVNKLQATGSHFGGAEDEPIILLIIWVVFAVEMVLRFFPSRMESMGCQKQFKRNYRPADPGGKRPPERMAGYRTFLVLLFWLLLNGVLGGLYWLGVYDEGVLILISLAYAVCDMICILFFCPFHTWIMKNKCCTTCRIYNWDFAMMFTPLLFIPHPFTWSLAGLSLILLLQWEIIYRRHPERFTENTNQSLACFNCQEKLCHHKRQLRHYLKRWRRSFPPQS